MHSSLRSQTLLAANTDETANTGTVYEIFTARREEFLYKLIIQSLGTNNATVLRAWLNNGSPRELSDNNSFLADITLAGATASQTSAQAEYEINLGLWIPEKSQLLCAIGTAASDGWQVTAVVGDDYAARYLL